MTKRKIIILVLLTFVVLFGLEINTTAYATDYVKVSVGGTASASSVYSSSYAASYAFDGSLSTYWCSASLAGGVIAWLRYQLSSPRCVDIYRIYPASTNYYFPKSWTFQGSNNGSTW
jgi:hypothetical protein